jgi:hypothetical protein
MFIAQITSHTIELCESCKRDRNMFQGQKPWAAMKLPEVSPKLWNKRVIHQFRMSQDSVLMQIFLNVKMAGHATKLNIRVKGNNMSKRTIQPISHITFFLIFIFFSHGYSKIMKLIHKSTFAVLTCFLMQGHLPLR